MPPRPWLSSTTGPVPALVYEIAPLFSGVRCSTAEAVEVFRPIALRAEGCRVTARFGRVCIVRFRDECTELPGCELSLSRRRRRGGVFRAGWAINQGSLYSCDRRPTRAARGCSLRVCASGRVAGAIDARNYASAVADSAPSVGCVEGRLSALSTGDLSRTAPVSLKAHRGGNPASWVRNSITIVTMTLLGHLSLV